MLTRDKIRKAHGPKFLEIAVPEWGDDDDNLLRVRRLTAPEWIRLSEQRQESDHYAFMAGLIQCCAVDEAGAPLFTDEDSDLLADSPLVVLRLGAQILRFNGLLREGDDAKKNSPTAL